MSTVAKEACPALLLRPLPPEVTMKQLLVLSAGSGSLILPHTQGPGHLGRTTGDTPLIDPCFTILPQPKPLAALLVRCGMT